MEFFELLEMFFESVFDLLTSLAGFFGFTFG